ncbi:MAG: Rrf2 family transcriptional regulator [Armatimonadetes bacterium]|nr:Rrf2 family transcriptional regulator [Armatimonadota bacterium]MDW8122364.1 Rrf2 family transcriptional regulator [Armatimonadota bacterium]
MRISTRIWYGLMAMTELGLKEPGRRVQVKEISEGQGIPAQYLEQLMIPLKRAGLVVSQRGARGGYSLSRSPEQITLLEIVNALEGQFLEIEPADPVLKERAQLSATMEVWRRLQSAMEQVLSSLTLAELCAWEREKRLAHPRMFFI